MRSRWRQTLFLVILAFLVVGCFGGKRKDPSTNLSKMGQLEFRVWKDLVGLEVGDPITVILTQGATVERIEEAITNQVRTFTRDLEPGDWTVTLDSPKLARTYTQYIPVTAGRRTQVAFRTRLYKEDGFLNEEESTLTVDGAMVLPLVKGNVWTYDYEYAWSNDGKEWTESQGTYSLEIVDVEGEAGHTEFVREQIQNGERRTVVPIIYDSADDRYTYGPRTLDFAAEQATYGDQVCPLNHLPGSWYYMTCPDNTTFPTYWADQIYTGVFEWYVPGKGLTQYDRRWTVRGLFYWTNLDRL